MRFVGVAWTGNDDSFQGFVDKHGLTFPTISDDAAVVFDRFAVPYQPAMAFVGRDGSVEVEIGAVSHAELTSRLDALAG